MTESTIHDLKLNTKYYDDVILRNKTFELRENDRRYKVGDLIKLNEWTGTEYTGRKSLFKIIYVLSDCEGLKKKYAILGIEPIKNIDDLINFLEVTL